MVRIAVIGAGAWGFNHVRTFDRLPDCQLQAVVDRDEKTLARVSTHFRDVETGQDYRPVVSREDIDAVVVATSAESHYQITRAALEAGKHVLVEKPLVLDSGQGREIVDLAGEKDLILAVGHLLLYHPAVERLKELVQSGELGDIYYLYSSRINLGKVRTAENALWSFAPHDISVMLHLVEAMPDRVSATGQSFLNAGIEDVAFFTLHFPGGAMGHGQVSWLDPHKIRKITVVGSKKMVVFDDMESAEKIRLYDKGVDAPPSYDSYGEYQSIRIGDIIIPRIQMAEPLRNECQHFLDCIQQGRRPLADGQEGLEVLRVLEAAQTSLKNQGVPVELGDE
jgi:predicted dehydrogenase